MALYLLGSIPTLLLVRMASISPVEAFTGRVAPLQKSGVDVEHPDNAAAATAMKQIAAAFHAGLPSLFVGALLSKMHYS